MGKISVNDIWNAACEKNIPIGAVIELTYKCNLECRHCYLAGEKGKELSLQEYKKILDELRRENTLFLMFTGGELFLRKDWFNIASYAKKKGFVLFFLTNGTLINEKIARKVKFLNPFRVEMSVYGASAEAHDAITRVKGSFEKTINSAKMLAGSGLMVVLKSVLMHGNIKEQKGIRELAESIGALYGINPKIFPRLDGSKKPLELGISCSELRSFYACHLDSEPNLEEVGKATSHGGQNVISCSVAGGAFSVTPFGDVRPCIRLPLNAGNLRKQGFHDIWNNSPVFLDLRRKRKELLEKCIGCKFLDYCNRCPAISYLEDGSISAINEANCTAARIRKEEIGKALERKSAALGKPFKSKNLLNQKSI